MNNPKKTALIIGAGAHVPYGFPTGKQLLDYFKMMDPHNQVVKRNASQKTLERIRVLQSRLHEYGKNAYKIGLAKPPLYANTRNEDVEKKILEIIKDFSKSGVPSIDAYLTKKMKSRDKGKEAQELGKYLICSIIRDYEKENPIEYVEHDWIHYLIKNFIQDKEGKDKFFNNPPQIITFNYDNLFERILCHHLRIMHDMTQEEAIKEVEKLGIMHVYGDIGSMYSFDDDYCIKHGMENIKVIGEDRNNLKEVSSRVRKKLEDVEYMYFLGFGFDKQNVEIIFGKNDNYWDDMSSCEFNFTNIGMSKAEIKEVYKIGDYKFMSDELKEVDCLSLIKDHYPIFETRGVVNKIFESIGRIFSG